MSHDDEHGDLTQDEVRRLLAESSTPDPMPEDVVTRLDSVLAGLVSERAAAPTGDEGPAGATVEPLVATLPTRRRRWPQLLAAAAAASVLGLGIGNLLQSDGFMAAEEDAAGSASQETAADSARDQASEGSADQPNALSDPEPDPPGEGEAFPGTAKTRGDVLRLRTRSLDLDLQRVQDFSLAAPTGPRWEAACARPRTAAGDEWLPVRLDDEAGVLLLRQPDGGRRQAEVYTCGSPDRPAVTGTVEVR